MTTTFFGRKKLCDFYEFPFLNPSSSFFNSASASAMASRNLSLRFFLRPLNQAQQRPLTVEELQNTAGFGFEDGLHDQLPTAIEDGDHNRFLGHVHVYAHPQDWEVNDGED
jgi:hypothetical protein